MTAEQTLQLTQHEQAMLDGHAGKAIQFCMRLVTRAAVLMGAQRLLPTRFLHIDACHYYGQAHLDFARTLVEENIRFEIPAWTNTVPVSLIQDEPRVQADGKALAQARELTDLYIQLGAKPVWTCAPYQLPGGPQRDEHIVVGESNAVCYFNSVVGARTNKYGDFLDVACGITKRVPEAGLHTDAGRRAQIQFDLKLLPFELKSTEYFCHVLGHLVGKLSGTKIPVITGLPTNTSKDSLKALGAAAAASGGVGLFHAVGVTPQAPTLEQAAQGCTLKHYHCVGSQQLIKARDSLSTANDGPLAMVALGTPHFSYTEFARLVELLDDRKIHPQLVFYVTTSRYVASLCEAKGWLQRLSQAGISVLVDTCTYFSPAVKGCQGTVMTNSAKWAYYAPGMLPVNVVFGSLADCIESAVIGRVSRDAETWSEKYWGAS